MAVFGVTVLNKSLKTKSVRPMLLRFLFFATLALLHLPIKLARQMSAGWNWLAMAVQSDSKKLLKA